MKKLLPNLPEKCWCPTPGQWHQGWRKMGDLERVLDGGISRIQGMVRFVRGKMPRSLKCGQLSGWWHPSSVWV